MPRVCGDCVYRDSHREICKLNLSYAAWVLPDQPANGCTGYHEAQRAAGEVQAQSECRGSVVFGMWQGMIGKKP